MKVKVISESPKETQQIARFFTEAIAELGSFSKNQALVVSLEGSLGSGKTEFLKGVAKGLELQEKIFSPTFLIMKSFPLSSKKAGEEQFFKTLWHLDCYRLKEAEGIKDLGFIEIVNNPQNLIFIEWGDKIKKLLPKKHIRIRFETIGKSTRALEIQIP
ncbi:MAG: tRNA (adenosine(37)-N6)-threonylcarbamoyltransferase complex ATPase subunit type 1 TsaE [Candidatus Pacebacteria bacterium]|nr:tRNA (adenosine(37)-N6)-threonylcarbamoyltransferase complex ATPase subunit type 1 TsaE [Candidatus Paceibacterota bacterium]